MIEVSDKQELRKNLNVVRQKGLTIAFVPTMGNLHQGHLALIEAARACADYVVVSIFVNPKQFGDDEDLSNYPRTLNHDKLLIADTVDLLFIPSIEFIYPDGSVTKIDVPHLTNDLCGKFRPIHFSGVLTVVNLLFNLVQPQFATFGKKDFQQLRLIQRMVTDLHLNITIIEVETGRESSGLAHSSRNRYLSDNQKKTAATISQVINNICNAIKNGSRNYKSLCNDGAEELKLAGFVVDYVAIRDSDSLQLPDNSQSLVVLVAARLGATRLIDNKQIELD